MAFWDDLEKKATDATTNVMSRVKGVSDTTSIKFNGNRRRKTNQRHLF